MATDPSLHVPAVVPDAPQDVLQPSKPEFEGATRLLSQSALVVTREIEMMNIFLGFEQANKYSIHAPSGELVGYLAEEEQGFMTGAMKRQLLRTHRPFRATVMDASGKPVLMIRRPFTWINSTAHIYAVRSDYPIGYGAPQDADLELIGEVQQRWHLYRRKYELFLRRREAEAESFQQFANIDAMLLSWTFMMQDADSKLVGAIDRNFRGFGREIFTDTGQYVLRFDSVGETAMTEARLTPPSSGSQRDQDLAKGMELVESHGTRALTLDERAVALATAVSIDFDYFSRHSEGAHGGGMFPWFYMGGMGGGGGNAEAPQGASSENVPAQQGGSADDGFGAGVAGGAMGGGMDYPYGPSDSGISQDSRLDQPPPNASGYGEDAPTSAQQDSPWWNADQQGQAQDGDVWGTADSDPWAGANDTQQQDSNSWGSWGGGDSGDGGGGWGGFFGGDGGGSDW